jgi:hypothetical protein
MRRNGRDAPIPAIRGTEMDRQGSTLKRPSRPRQRIVELTRKRSFAPDRRACRRPDHVSSSSSAFASLRSGVSKPSVNHP